MTQLKVSKEQEKAVKSMGFLRNKGTDNFSGRVITVNGVINAAQQKCIGEAAELFGSGNLCFTSRLTIEVQGIPYEKIPEFRSYIAKENLITGGTGTRVRPVVSCKGTTCQYGLIDTFELSEKIHNKFFVGYGDLNLPHKFKIAVGGCPNSCVKPDLNDVGIVGQRKPIVDESLCRGCKKCIIKMNCPIDAPEVIDGVVKINQDICNRCGRCINNCVFKSITKYENGYKVYVGGRWGKQVSRGKLIDHFFKTEEEVLEMIEKIMLYYTANGLKKERLSQMIDRIGFEKVQSDLLTGDILLRRDEIVAANTSPREAEFIEMLAN